MVTEKAAVLPIHSGNTKVHTFDAIMVHMTREIVVVKANTTTQVKSGEVGGWLPSDGSLLLRIWLLSAFGKRIKPLVRE